MTDAELQELYHRCAPALFQRCLSIVKDEQDAHDIVQDTFARVLRRGDQFRGESSPMTWMYRISTNLALNHLRNRSGRQDKLDHHGDQLLGYAKPQPRPDDGHADADADRVLSLLAGCDDEIRAVVVHTYFDDCTRRETARLVGLSVPTVRKRLRSFLRMAREHLDLPPSAQETG